MTTIEVLRELPYSICEIDIDDIIIFAHTKEEMTERLDIVLRCLQEYNATVTPEKCSFEKTKVEFMGHTMDKDGLNFSREKLDKVLMVPQSGKDLKPFLGVCVYVNDMRTTTVTSGHPPHAMIRTYESQRRLHWTTETIEAFYELQKAVNECPMVHFANTEWPIYVVADTSDYGIGATCNQMNADHLKECFTTIYALSTSST